MKISVNDTELYTLSQTKLDVLANDIHIDELEDTVKGKLQWTLMEKYENCYKRLFAEWLPKLAARGVQSIPTDKEAFAQLVFSQPDYKDRATRNTESQL